MPNCPFLWPEDNRPDTVLSCDDCELAVQGSPVVWGEGSPTGPVVVILDNPGARKDTAGHPYLCSTRETLQTTAYEAGFTPDDLYVTYLLKRRPRRKYDKNTERKRCLPNLLQQIQERKPLLVVCLGDVAVQACFDDPQASVKTMRGRLHWMLGCHAVASYHPLAVRRRPNLYACFLEDWQFAFRLFLEGKEKRQPTGRLI